MRPWPRTGGAEPVLTLGSLSFAVPWALAALAVLPVIWWLLRITPPAPARRRFPPVRLLLALVSREESAAKTPPWFLALRLALAAAVIAAAAHPLLNAGSLIRGQGPLILVIDDGWAAAADWPARRAMAASLLDEAERQGRVVVVATTAPAAGEVRAQPPQTIQRPADARRLIEGLQPKPWATRRQEVADALAGDGGLDLDKPGHSVWLSDGLDDGDAEILAEALVRLGTVNVFGDAGEHFTAVLRPPVPDGDTLIVKAERAVAEGAASAPVSAIAEDGTVLAREVLRFAAGEAATDVPARPADGAAQPTRPPRDRRRRHRRRRRAHRRALAPPPGGPLFRRRRPCRSAAAQRDLLPGAGPRSLHRGASRRRCRAPAASAGGARSCRPWSPGGGGPPKGGAVDCQGRGWRCASPARGWPRTPTCFCPCACARATAPWAGPCRGTGRPGWRRFAKAVRSSALRWPDGVFVKSQVLAQPSLDLADKTWAELNDGTPLVSAEKRGEGWLVLVHTTANTAWTNLPLSGLFVEMLKRLVDLSQGGRRQSGGSAAAHAGARRLRPADGGAGERQGDRGGDLHRCRRRSGPPARLLR